MIPNFDGKWKHSDNITSSFSFLSQTTNFILFQIERVCRRQFRIWWKWWKVLQRGRKRCGKRRNFSLQVIFSFSRSVSKTLLLKWCETRAPFVGRGLTHYHTMPHFDALKIYSFEKTLCEQEKLLVTSNFSFSHNIFSPIWHLCFLFLFWMHFQMTSAICFNLDQSRTLTSGKRLRRVFSGHNQEVRIMSINSFIDVLV